MDKVKFIQVSASTSVDYDHGQVELIYAVDSKGRIWSLGYDRKWYLNESPDEPKENEITI